nr:hypothetical protein [Tanacetum cinerariifolium]
MRRVGKGFLEVETPLFATMLIQPPPPAAEEEDEVEVPAALTQPSPTIKPSPPPQEPIPTPPQAQPAPSSSPPQEQPTTTSESDMTLLNTLMETCVTLSQKVAHLEQDKIAQALEIIKLKKRVKKLEKKRRSKSFGLKRLRKGRKDDDNATIKEVSAAEPTVFDDEEENIDWNVVVKQMQEKYPNNIKKYPSLKRKPISVAQARKNMIVYLKNMVGYKMEHFKGMTYDKVRPIFEKD